MSALSGSGARALHLQIIDHVAHAIDAARKLQVSQALTSSVEELCRQVLLRLLEPTPCPADDPLTLPISLLLDHPGLLGLLAEVPNPDDDQSVLRFDTLTDPLQAARH